MIEGARAEAAAWKRPPGRNSTPTHQALRSARAEIYEEQEDARQVVLDERAQLLKAMRSRSQDEVSEAKKKIAADSAAARAEIEKQTPALADEIARMILDRRPAARRRAAPVNACEDASRWLLALAGLAPVCVCSSCCSPAPAWREESRAPA